jgi:hypothetical protein
VYLAGKHTIFREDFCFWPRSKKIGPTTAQSNTTTFAPLLKTMMSSTPSPDEESLSQMTASTRASFFSATSTGSTSTSTNSPHREQVDQSYLTPFEGTTKAQEPISS